MSLYANRFAGRAAIVTGGASGLGLQVATRIAAEGGKVALWDINPDALAEAKKSSGAQATFAVDVSDHQAVAKAASESNAALGRIDILVASAGITGATVPVSEFPVDSWLRVMDVNLNGLFYCCREVIPFMAQNEYGRIVNVASVAGKEGNPNASAYSASKAGVIGLTKSLGKELATTGVLVNCVAPAVVKTELFSQMTEQHIQFMLSKIPMNRFGEVDEVAELVSWLASPLCTFSTASVFDLSGGRATY
jgi:3-oxoacyl-[acyl-carrier protein] reductase